MKPHSLFQNIMVIVVFSLSLLTPEHRRSGVTTPVRMPAMNTPVALPPLFVIAAIATGDFHTCVVTSGGGVKCWGSNPDGQLGDGTYTNHYMPVSVSGLASGVSAISTSSEHTCALTSGGGVKCWGSNYYGQLGDGTYISRHTPVNVSGLASGVIAIAAGGEHTCALTVEGGVKCWGHNDHGQLGDGTTTDRLTPVFVSGLDSGVWAIASGVWHTCALTAGGGVKCWGYNLTSQLGDGTNTDRLTPVSVNGLASRASAITTGFWHTCVLTVDGGVKCWGDNFYGQLGDGTTNYRSTPENVSGLVSGVSAIATSDAYNCALTAGGGVKCWGLNEDGQLGDGTTTDRLIPVNVSGLSSGVSAIDTGSSHTCALTSGGEVLCWGNNFHNQLGDGTNTDRLTPVYVNVLASGGSTIAAGAWHTCAMAASGWVKCWGVNDYGQLGDGTYTNHHSPVYVSGLTSNVYAIAAGLNHSCAMTTSGVVKCWGYNGSGQLGDGTTTDRLTPVSVNGLGILVRTIAAGYAHTCAVIEDGVRCWGANQDGQLGNGTTTDRLTPVSVSGLASEVSAISTGYAHTCALTAGGEVKCWGANWYGQLGDGTTIGRLTPVNVSGLASGLRDITTGYAHTCALTDGGGVLCWGANDYGQLGDATTTSRLTPVSVSGLLSGVIAIDASSFHTCALTADGTIKCWGANQDGQLGDGTTINRLTPVSVSDLESGVSSITTGFWHTCALTKWGGFMCWGFNGDGELGDGTTTNRLTPVSVIGLVS